jgi:ATP phosphoribosyltransferase regulatory subunit
VTIARLRRALERKDEDAVRRALSGEPEASARGRQGVDARADCADLFVRLLRSVGPAEAGIAALRAIGLPAEGRAEAERLAAAVQLVQHAAPDLRLTIDPVEYRGLEYQTGVSFTFYALNTRGELGRGGRYLAGYPEDAAAVDAAVVPLGATDSAGGERTAAGTGIGHTEPATGFTLYMDTVSNAARLDLPGRRLYVPAGTPWSDLASWQQAGYLTVRGFASASDVRAEARRLGCTHALVGGQPVSV